VAPASNGTPRLSVVTPLFNCLERTKEMVESLRASIPKNIPYEVILVDDGSTDGTRQWLSGLGDPFRVLLNERNVGYGASTNRGAAAARGAVLALLNDDLVLPGGWLQPMLSALGRGVGVVGNVQVDAATGLVDHAGIWVNLKGKPEHVRSSPGWARRLLRPRPGVFAVTGACMLVRAETWRRLGGFDEGFVNGGEDLDFCLRTRAAGLGVVLARRSRVLHHVSSSPGRKLRDEENSQRLVLRWRQALAVEASRLWTRGHFAQVLPEPRDFPDKREALQMALYILHLAWSPPASAVAAMGEAVDLELARWRQMFTR
jgi:GT2 family glycosyltransferase